MPAGEAAPGRSTWTEVRSLERSGDARGALALLRDRLRQNLLGPEELQLAGRHARRLLKSPAWGQSYQHVLLLGQCTTTWLCDALAAVALRHDLPCVVEDGPYDNVLQALDQLLVAQAPDLLVLLPWHERLLSAHDDDQQARIGQELVLWQQAWRLAAERGVKRMIQIGYDWIVPGARGYHLESDAGGNIDSVRRLNQAMRASLPSGSYFVPLEELSGTLGRRQFYDARRQHWTRQPFSETGLAVLSEHVVAGLRALTTGPKKLLVVDLDNTLWGGIVGEAGALGVELGDSPAGEAFRNFQHHLRALSRRGVLLAVCSKNNEADAREPFQHNPDMVLRLEDIACFVASWEPKPDGLRRIASELGLGLDSFVFFDDDPFERDLVRQTLPQVEVVDVPEEPSRFVETLQAGLWFESCGLTTEDRERTRIHAADAQRRAAQAAASLPDYLASLGMRGQVRHINETDMPRVVQLLAKTNQFNLTTRRHTADDVRQLLRTPGGLGLTLRVADRFSDHGLVAVVIAVPDPDSGEQVLRIDSLLMSCRVIGRTVETFLMQELLRLATGLGYASVVAEFVPTARNSIVVPFLERCGFAPLAGSESGSCLALQLPWSGVMQTFVADHA